MSKTEVLGLVISALSLASGIFSLTRDLLGNGKKAQKCGRNAGQQLRLSNNRYTLRFSDRFLALHFDLAGSVGLIRRPR